MKPTFDTESVKTEVNQSLAALAELRKALGAKLTREEAIFVLWVIAALVAMPIANLPIAIKIILGMKVFSDMLFMVHLGWQFFRIYRSERKLAASLAGLNSATETLRNLERLTSALTAATSKDNSSKVANLEPLGSLKSPWHQHHKN